MMDGDAALFLFNEVLNSDSSTSSEDEVQARGPMNIVEKGKAYHTGKSPIINCSLAFWNPRFLQFKIHMSFNIGRATALRTVRRVAEALFSLSKTICKWPTGEYIEEVMNGFTQMGFLIPLDVLMECMENPKPRTMDFIHKQKRISKYYLKCSSKFFDIYHVARKVFDDMGRINEQNKTRKLILLLVTKNM
ncbi:hypothetical protein JTB14_011238 [Gonioctena quinquepunctata]|nr:hypothetical protein JTB14_011238 [Gonioctena quinquepunctata]